jgi:ribosome-associated protein
LESILLNSPENIKNLVIHALEDLKAQEIIALDVKDLTSVTDFMIICHGTSSRHLKAISDNVVEMAKASDVKPLGVEGEQSGEWVLVDLGDAIVHIMLKPIREFYQLERLWAPENRMGHNT